MSRVLPWVFAAIALAAAAYAWWTVARTRRRNQGRRHGGRR